jgi:signal transduction histidine kinase/CheY-like chemotaxis protein/HPt (histidine-containing phosphotransfer) domain-containing protein
VVPSLSALSLRWRIAAASTVVVLLVSLFVGIYYPARSARIAIDAQKQSVAGAAEMVALSVGVGLDLEEPRAIAAAFAWARRDSSLRFVAVLDTAGTVLATYNPDQLVVPVATERLRHVVHEWRGHFMVAARVRFQDLKLGDVVIASSLATIHAKAAAERRAGLAGSAILFLLGIALSLWTASRITRPIVTLRHATEQIANGHYDVELDVRAGAEVGALAAAFTTMAGTVRRQMADLGHQATELATARDAALSATVAKSAFLATMSHEIRTPMNGVIGMLELLDDGPLRTQQREFVRTASRSAEALLTIINDILDFSKVEAGKLDIERIEFDLWHTVEDVTTLLGERAHAKGLELITAIDPDVPTVVWGDPGRLRQILLNLAGNAIKFTESGQVVVKVARALTDDDPSRIRFEITDSGPGIPPDVTARLFQPFSQADSSTTRRFGGTGLGLAICRQLVGLMGGEVGVTSVVGTGSTFWFTTQSEPVVSDPQPQPGSSVAGLTALVVDDNQTNGLVLSEMLTAWGMETTVANSGEDALAVLREMVASGGPPAFALIDMQMPGMDGIALGRVIRKDPALQGVQLILLTAFGGQENLRAHGFSAYLVKPVRQKQLHECLLRVGTDPDARDAAATADPAASIPTTRAGDILLVEDNEVNQLVGVELLQRLGYCVDVAPSGLDALTAVESKRYDAVLMDCQMTGMDGFEATAELRRRDWSSDRLPIIAMTANAMQGDRERCLAAGMDDYLAKPVRRAALTAVLDRFITAMQPPEDVTPTAAAPLLDSALDTEQLQDLLGDDRVKWRRYLALFLGAAAAALSSLSEGIAQQQPDAVRRAAHRLKGSAATVGATVVAALAAQLETIAETGDWHHADGTHGQLEAAVGRLATIMETL